MKKLENIKHMHRLLYVLIFALFVLNSCISTGYNQPVYIISDSSQEEEMQEDEEEEQF